jgi:NADH-quinone oxidoreductase subunit C
MRIDKLTTEFQDAVAPTESGPWPALRVRSDAIARVCQFAKSDPDLDMDYLPTLTAVDWEDRFEMVYHLYSTRRRHGLVLKVDLPHDGPHIATVSGVWRAANWHEREVFDMFGIAFDGHPDLRRILMPEGTRAFPLRRDFDFIDDPDDPLAVEPKPGTAG